MSDTTRARCDLHVHSRFSTDSGNYALRRARLPESFTEPERVFETCIGRGMDFVTISDHNTLAGALRIADRPGTFLSVEVTTCFPEDELPLHVLVWNLTEEDHADLQAYRGSVYELVDFLRERRLAHGLAHPLYRMGAPISAGHVERMMLLFGVWEGRNGARPREQNDLAARLAESVTPAYLEKLAERHRLEPRHEGRIALVGGSDDHAALDIATTWTEATGATVSDFLSAACRGDAGPEGAHGSTLKLAHALASVGVNAYRTSGGQLPDLWSTDVQPLFETYAEDIDARHAEIAATASAAARLLAAKSRQGAALADLPSTGERISRLLLAGALGAPYVASAHHHAGSRAGLRDLERAFFGLSTAPDRVRALVFTDTFDETNGVAGTMRALADAARDGLVDVQIVVAGNRPVAHPAVLTLAPDWSLPLPAYESLSLRAPTLTDVLTCLDDVRPDVVHVVTPGPVGLCGLAAAKLLGIPLVGSYHTELGPYALHLTRDALVADVLGAYVDWFYRVCDLVLAPSAVASRALAERGYGARLRIWGRGVDVERFSPRLRNDVLRRRLLRHAAGPLLLSVGRLSREKRVDVLLDAFASLTRRLPEARLVVAGDGPARPALEERAAAGVRFLGELHGRELAELYASADVFCFPSTTDTFGQVLIEAAASGLPAVAAWAGGAAELVLHDETGILVTPDDPEAFAEALLDLASSPALRERLGERARASAAQRTWRRSFDELREAYALAVERAHPEPSGPRATVPVPAPS